MMLNTACSKTASANMRSEPCPASAGLFFCFGFRRMRRMPVFYIRMLGGYSLNFRRSISFRASGGLRFTRTAAFSAEYGFPRAVAVRAKAHADLFFAAFFFGERRQIVLVKAADPDRLRIFGKFSAELVAEVEYLDHTVCVRRKIVKIAVLHGDDRLHRDVEPPLPPSFP